MSDDLNFQQISTVQSGLQPAPKTIASAATIAVTTFISFISGTVQVTKITPPVSGAHMLVLIFTNANPGGVGTGGSGAGAFNNTLDVAQYAPLILFYDPTGAKYYAGVLALA
jgi:hypothetical protein